MIRYFLLFGFFLLFATDAQAQRSVDAEFGSIPDSLFQMQPPAENSDAPYVITNKELDISFRETGESIVAVLEHHVRLKVFDEEAKEASIIAVPYYFDNNMEQISSIQGNTYLPTGREVALSEQDVKTININSRYNVKEFIMPAVEKGAVMEYRYVIERRYIEELPDFFLAHEVPTSVAKLTITYPEYLRYQSFVENYEGPLHHDFVYTDTSSVPKIFTIPQPKPVVTERWVAYDVPGVQEEAFISTLDDYRAKIKFLLSEFGLPRQELENNWEVVVARMREKTNPWQTIRQNSLAKSKGDSIAKALTGEPKQVVQDSIFHFLNSRINFSGANSPYSTQKDVAVLTGEPADQATINQALIAMLRGADINAKPVLVSTRQSGKINMDFPSFYQFNSQLVQSTIGDSTFIMDGSFTFSQPGLIPADMFGSRGLVLAQDSYEWREINPDKSAFNIQMQIDAQLDSDGNLFGKVKAVNQGYPAQQVRQYKADGLSEVQIIKQTLFESYPQVETDSVRIKNADTFGKPVKLSAKFEITRYATSFTDGLKFRPMIVGYQSENPFEDTNRNFPITLDAPENLDVSYSISLPEGYATQQGRQNQTLALPDARLQEQYDFNNNTLKYGYQIDISRKEFSKEFFPQLYNLYKRWVELSNTAWLIENRN